MIDKRIGEKSTKMSEDEKMKLRYMREQRDKLKQKTGVISKRKAKYNLEDELWSDDNEDHANAFSFTHKGKPLRDDFDKHDIPQSSDEEDSPDKGRLDEEMVTRMNFGGGEEEKEDRKSR